ncbi:MAG TPA: DUF1553 domain-containing protein, partial [Methylomirabilota bacterium]|nr:DUF1553 domain-containing protein [Methylomirabilota bacterium]
DVATRLVLVAKEDSDGDGVANETELLLGHQPGDAKDTPAKKELAEAAPRHAEFARYLASYRWQPFEPVVRPDVPKVEGTSSTSPTLSSTREKSGTRVTRPSNDTFSIRNPIDAFIAAEHQSRGLKPRPAASKEILLRRVYLDLIGLSPTPEELAAFESDKSPAAYDRVVDRLLADPRYGERWGRHWMDVWRYSDWAGWSGGNQIRDSKPHIWKWRDWIVESLNADKPYTQMIVEMLAADELAPLDTNTLRATGFLVRNYKMLSREQWLEDTVKHTAQAFLGVTVGCAKCHDHMTDPISQAEYYQMRAIFEPHWVRTDRVPGDTNLMNAGLVRTFDTDTNPPTYFFRRGDERKPDTNRVMEPDVPKALGGGLEIQPVSLPWIAGHPDKRDFIYRDTLAAAEKEVAKTRAALTKVATNSATSPDKLREHELSTALVEAQRDALAAGIEAERLEDAREKGEERWKIAATNAVLHQRKAASADSTLKLHQARLAAAEARKKSEDAAEKLALATNEAQQVTAKKEDSLKAAKDAAAKTAKALTEAKKKLTEAGKLLADAEEKLKSPPDAVYKRRSTDDYPTNSTGRRLAFARWLASTNNPLTARVAANQIWLRHFGHGLAANPADFGRAARPPSHPQLLDWLAAEFMNARSSRDDTAPSSTRKIQNRKRESDASLLTSAATGWSMKHLHRLIVTSSTYRMASTPDERNAKIDPDNTFLWRMNSRRMEAEVVRDNLLYVSGSLDLARGGPDIDHNIGLKSKRRSIYFRQAAEKEMEFLKIFDGPAVTECYVRRPTVVPQQALAMANSELTLNEARLLAKKLSAEAGDDAEAFARAAFERILARHPKPDELNLCREFLETRTPSSSVTRAREALVTVLFNHNDFITVR